MEKWRIKSEHKFSRRLLISLILLFQMTAVHAKFISQSDLDSLSFKPDSYQQWITNSDIKFEVVIPEVSPEELSVDSPVLPDNVVFKSLLRTEDYSQEEIGTRIEVWLSFSKKGTYQLQPLSLRVGAFRRKIAFDPIKINFNPKEQLPVLHIHFADGTEISSEDSKVASPVQTVKTGQKIKFTVYCQYAVQLIQYDWDIPKDSIFAQTKAYEITESRYRENDKSDVLIPVSDFEWEPLVSGEMTFPTINMVATSFAGYKSDLKLPSFTIKVLEGNGFVEAEKDNLFADAFTEVVVQHEEEPAVILTREDCQKIADLRIKERKSIFGKARKERIAFETSAKLPADKNEFKLIYLGLVILAIIVTLIFDVLLFRKKKILEAIVVTVFLVCETILLINCGIQSKTKNGIFAGTEVRSIPEEVCESKFELMPGSYVKVLKETGKWLYIEVGESGGWCYRDDVIIIR